MHLMKLVFNVNVILMHAAQKDNYIGHFKQNQLDLQ
jgi:hypothetical protein